jgi:hypothetical protein
VWERLPHWMMQDTNQWLNSKTIKKWLTSFSA